jgi:hypothetical protein
VYVASPVDGAPLARIGVDPKLAGQTDFVEAVLRAAGTALDNARLQAELRAGQREAEQSSRQLDRAEATHRRITRLPPGGLAERISRDPEAFTTTELLTVTVLTSDIRGYTAIAEQPRLTSQAAPAGGSERRNRSPPSASEHRCGRWPGRGCFGGRRQGRDRYAIYRCDTCVRYGQAGI